MSSSIVPNIAASQYPSKTVYDYLGYPNTFPVCKVHLKCLLYNGFVDAVIAPLKFCSVLLGSIKGASDFKANVSQVVKTRPQKNILCTLSRFLLPMLSNLLPPNSKIYSYPVNLSRIVVI